MKRIRHYISQMDGHILEVLSGAAVAFVLRGFGAGLAFALNVVIARQLGAEGAGVYFMALSVAMIGSVVARLGLENAVLRFVAVEAANENWGLVKGVRWLSLKLAGGASLGLAALCFFFAPEISEYIFDEPALVEPLRWMSFAIVTFSVMTLESESLKGLKKIRDSMLVSGVLFPAFALLLIGPLVAMMGPSGASAAYVLGTGLAALIGVIFWRKAMSVHLAPAAAFPRDILWASSRPLWVTMILTRAILPWAPLFLLGIWGSTQEVGIFGAALRISMLVTFFLVAVNTVLAPKFAELYTKGDLEALGKLVRKFSVIIPLATSPMFFLLLFKSAWVMQLFGKDFAFGGKALAILALGQAVITMTGSAGSLLMMTGHEKDVRNSAIIGGVFVGGLSLILIPSLGHIGAAIAASTAIAASNIASVVFVRKRLGIMTVPFMPLLDEQR